MSEPWELEQAILMLLYILHQTNVSKKAVADYARDLVGLKPGQPVVDHPDWVNAREQMEAARYAQRMGYTERED